MVFYADNLADNSRGDMDYETSQIVMNLSMIQLHSFSVLFFIFFSSLASGRSLTPSFSTPLYLQPSASFLHTPFFLSYSLFSSVLYPLFSFFFHSLLSFFPS